eukprot:Gb_08435 [translate_table: standard]
MPNYMIPLNVSPLKNIPPYDSHDHHIHIKYRKGTSPHHSKVSCDLKTTLLDSRDFAHILYSSFRRPQTWKVYHCDRSHLQVDV